jgi:hypothetical protein
MGPPLNLSSAVPFVDAPPIAPYEFFENDPLEMYPGLPAAQAAYRIRQNAKSNGTNSEPADLEV